MVEKSISEEVRITLKHEINNIKYTSLLNKNSQLYREKSELKIENEFLLFLFFSSLFVNFLFLLYFLKTLVLS
ncbi:hypothetical protein SAMN05443634_105203 [Chishuiella changwenlii]|uniref:Uncharacterized protein n=1 Tax=Chishuiella changwenlii TaxID=1434701 RepID=A0A1M6XCY8_9FLAO|nr:hypothetical protein GCM10010984_17560 [Chishuiella changwenlii]SHL03811.1 hypothetical protein SAMN05443634_105203 [Chishuiella changwenlii]